jgi:nucleotide-binding universal stress UspA family protein
MAEPAAPERKRVVVGIDGSPSSVAAVRWALDEATRHDADVEAISCWRTPLATEATGFAIAYLDPACLGAPSAEALDRTLASVHDAVEAHRRHGLTLTMRVLEGLAGPTLVAESKGALLLVVGRRGESRLSHLFLGSTSRFVVTHAPCPVTVVPESTS